MLQHISFITVVEKSKTFNFGLMNICEQETIEDVKNKSSIFKEAVKLKPKNLVQKFFKIQINWLILAYFFENYEMVEWIYD